MPGEHGAEGALHGDPRAGDVISGGSGDGGDLPGGVMTGGIMPVLTVFPSPFSYHILQQTKLKIIFLELEEIISGGAGAGGNNKGVKNILPYISRTWMGSSSKDRIIYHKLLECKPATF